MRELKRLLRLLAPEWASGSIGMLLSVMVHLSNIALLALSGWFITAMAISGLGGPRIEYFAPAAAIRGLAILRTVGRYLERVVTHDATFRQLTRLRVWFYEALEPLAPARLQGFRAGDLLSRIRADIDSLEIFYLRVLVPSLAALIGVPLLVLFLAGYSMHVALLDGAGLVLVGLLLPLLAQRLGRGAGVESTRLRGQLSADVTDLVRGFSEFLIEGALQRQSARCLAEGDALLAVQRRAALISAAATALSGLAANLTLWLALLVAVPLVASQQIGGADLAMLSLFVMASFDVVGGLPAVYLALGESVAAARRIFEIADLSPAVAEPQQPAAVPTRFDLAVEHLQMRYAPEGPWVLQDLSFALAQGSSLGITGPSGAGKSSLLNTLLRFWDYQGGSITLGGVELRALEGEAVRSLCAVVAQRTHLFNTSIRENLVIARPDATEGELRHALQQAALLDEVLAMPQGLDTRVGEGGQQVSGGQARRISIARAFLKDAPIMLLDEPTEGLDVHAERAVLQALARLMQGRTSLLVSHRPQPLALVDRILVLK